MKKITFTNAREVFLDEFGDLRSEWPVAFDSVVEFLDKVIHLSKERDRKLEGLFKDAVEFNKKTMEPRDFGVKFWKLFEQECMEKWNEVLDDEKVQKYEDKISKMKKYK